MPLRSALLIVFLLVVYSCSTGVKYPAYRLSERAKHRRLPGKQQQAPRRFVKKSSTYLHQGVVLLKRHRCAEAISFFKSFDSFRSRYCLLVAYGICGRYAAAGRIFRSLADMALSNRWEARLYATYGLFLCLQKSRQCRDYVTVAYAYDSKNSVAVRLLRSMHINSYRRRAYFNTLYGWCENGE